MSLKDTIRGARAEVDANGNPFERKKRSKTANEQDASSATSAQRGFTRKSATKAKPTRAAAEGVHVVSGNAKPKKTNMSKAERKAERKHDREVDDLRYNVSQQMLEEREEYKRHRKIWWRFLIAGVACMVIALILYAVVSNQGEGAPPALAIGSMVSMVLAYVVVIAGLAYDWFKIRPLRREVDSYVHSLSEKRLVTVINKNAKGSKSSK